MSVEFDDTEWISEPLNDTTLATVAETISQMDEAAKAEYFPGYAFETTGQVLSSVAVRVKTKITMPHWTRYDAAPQAEKDEWDRFCAALRGHELGHIGLVVEHLGNIDESLVSKSVSAAERIWANALASLNSATLAYDRETEHGLNQGAIIDVTVAGP